jgi:hypothetical protein
MPLAPLETAATVPLIGATTGNGTSTTPFVFVSGVRGRVYRVGATALTGTIAGGATCAVTVQNAGGTASSDITSGQFFTPNGSNVATAPVASDYTVSASVDAAYVSPGDIITITPAAGTGTGTYRPWVVIRTNG